MPASFELGPAGPRRADRQVLLAAVAAEERLERGDQGHEQGAVLRPAAGAQVRRQLARQPEPVAVAAVGLDRRTRPVGGQLQRGEPRQRLLPVGQQRLAPLAGQGLPLQPHVLLVGQARRRQLRRPGAGRLAVQRRHLAHHDRERPEVGHDVVDDEEDHRPAGIAGPGQQRDAQERPAARGRTAARPPRPGATAAAPRSSPSTSSQASAKSRCPATCRQRLAVDGREGRAQGGVAVHQGLERALQRAGVHRREQAHRGRDVVGASHGREVVQEPERALAVGERRPGAGGLPAGGVLQLAARGGLVSDHGHLIALLEG